MQDNTVQDNTVQEASNSNSGITSPRRHPPLPPYTLAMALTLDPATEARIQRELARGRYAAPDEIINRALDLLEAERADLAAHRAMLLAELEESLDQADRNEVLTEEELRARMSARREAHQRTQAA